MEVAHCKELLARYRDGPRALADALAGISERELDARQGPHDWTAREIVHHLADSEVITAIRLRRLLAEDNPVLEAYDEGAYARLLRYRERPIGPSLEAVWAAVESTVSILERLDPAEWGRPGVHVERGRYTPEIALDFCAGHLHGHADQIIRARAN